LVCAQGKVHIDFGAAGDRDVWVADAPLVPASTLKSKEATLDLPLPTDQKSRLYIWDHDTGNLASKAIGELKGIWKPTSADFTLIGKVTVRVEHEGEPVAVAFVKLKDGSGERESQIDPGKKGEAIFFGVKPGNIEVTVRYNVDGQDATPVKQSSVLELKRTQSDPAIVISLSDKVETVGEKTPSKEATHETKAAPESGEKPIAQGGNGIGSIIVYLIAIGVAGAAIYFVMQYMKNNQVKVSDQLKKLGVQIPDPQDPAQQDPGPAPIPVAPAPPEKIILVDADPNVPAALTSVPMAAGIPAVTVSQPSLVMENGDVFAVPEGETSVGREATNGLSLISESTVSRRHATLTRTGNEVLLRDEGSSNGTFVNGVKIASDTALRPGDQVQFGQARFRYEA